MPDYDMHKTLLQYGQEQLEANLEHMFRKEGAPSSSQPGDKPNFQHNPIDYLGDVHEGRISPQLREEAFLSILQFTVQTECLDQTVLQGVHLADNYLRYNPNIQPAFLRIIYAMSLEIAIKMNEQMILSLEDIAALFENRFTIGMLSNLERHILTLNSFRINCATPLDFALHFCVLEKGILENGPFELPVEGIVNDALHLLHYALSNYEVSRKKYSSIAVAAICHVLQSVHHDYQSSLEAGADGPRDFTDVDLVSPMQRCRDDFLDSLFAKF